MLAAVLTELNAPLVVEEVGLTPLDFGQVLVRVLAAGICGAQLQEIRGEKGGPVPHLLGHEGVGIVEGVGVGVTRVKVGDKCVMHWRKAAGIESAPPRYIYQGREITSGLVTTFSQKSICSENRLTPIPAATCNKIATLLGCSLSTALATVESEARWGERVMVIGCGGLGLALLGALEMVEPRQLCACDLHEEKRLPVEQAGADFVNLSSRTMAGSYDLILDTAGAAETTEAALECLAPSGRYVMIGQPKPGKPVCLRNARHFFDGDGKQLRATQGGGFQPHLDIPRFLKIAESPAFNQLVTDVLPLERINDALDLVRAGRAGRIMIAME